MDSRLRGNDDQKQLSGGVRGTPEPPVEREGFVDLRKIKKLIDLLDESNLAEMEIKEGEETIRLSRMPKGMTFAAPVAAPPVTHVHVEQRPQSPASREGDMRLAVVDEEDVAGLRPQRPLAEHELARTVNHQRDLEVIVPVHRVPVAQGGVLDHRQREVRVHVLLPDVDGHGAHRASAQPYRTGPYGGFPGTRWAPRPLLPLLRP